MTNHKIEYDRDLQKDNRPYYLIPDNFKSNYRIYKLDNFMSINNIQTDKNIRKATSEIDYFETSYLADVRRNAVKINQ